MKTLHNLKLIGISTLLVVGLAACNKPVPSNNVTKKVDKTGNQVSDVMDDATLTGKVKAAIFAEPGLKALQINVDTVQGVVTLSGTVDSMASSDRAKSVASEIIGVKSVENRLVVNS